MWQLPDGEVGVSSKMGKGDQEVQTISYNISKSWDILYSMDNRVNNIVFMLYGD